MRRMLALARKDLRVLTRVKAALFFTFVWPIVVAVLFGYVFSGQAAEGGAGAMRVAVVDEDQTDQSREYIARLDRASELDVTPATRDEAARLVRRGQRAAFVVIAKGFGEASGRLFYGEQRRVEVGIDPARQAEAGMLQGLLVKYAMEDTTRLLGDPAASRKMVDEALGQIRLAQRAGDLGASRARREGRSAFASAIFSSSVRVIVPPVGLVGKFSTRTLLRGVMACAIALARTAKPSSARHDTGTATPCVRVMLGE